MKTYKVILLLMLISLSSSILRAQENIGNYLSDLIGVNNYGTEFYLTVIPAFEDNLPPIENAVKLFIISPVKTKVNISVPGKLFSIQQDIAPGKTEIIVLSPEIATLLRKNPNDPEPKGNIYNNAAIRVESEHPIAVYVLLQYRRISEGYLALPTSSLGTQYVVSTYTESSSLYPLYNNFPAMAAIVASEDNTFVSFKMGGNEQSMTSDNIQHGQQYLPTKTLHKGDVWLISTKGKGADLSGSFIEADKPVSVISGNYTGNVPVSNKWSSYLTEMLIPVNRWGTNYITSNIKGRKYAPIFRIYALSNDTEIYYNSQLLNEKKISNPLTGSFFIEYRPDKSNVHHFHSTKPISVTMFNTGVEEDGLPLPDGAPFQMLLPPLEQLQKLVFFSFPEVSSGYTSNYINVMFEMDGDGTIPDDLLLGTVLNGEATFLPIEDFSVFDIVTIPGEIDGKKYAVLTLRLSNNRNYFIKSENGTAVTLYGFSETEAYGYPASLKLHDLTSIDNVAPISTWQIECDGSIKGTTKDMPNDASIRSNLAFAIKDDLISISNNYIWMPKERIVSGQTVSFNWELQVKQPLIEDRAVVYISDVAGNMDTIDIHYIPPKPAIEPDYKHFGTFTQSDSPTLMVEDFVLVNNSDMSINITDLVLKKSNSGFEIIKPNLPIKLSKNNEIPFKIRFEPENVGSFTDSIGIVNECLNLYLAKVEIIIGEPQIEVNDVAFGEVTVGTNKSEKVYIRNTGKVQLVVTEIIHPSQNVFKLDMYEFPSRDNPLILQPGKYDSLTVIFTPNLVQDYQDKIEFVSDANRIKNISFINAIGTKPGLTADSYNWNRKTIHRNEYPAGPYPVVNQNNGILLQNTGSETIVISNFDIIEISGNKDAFEFNASDLLNKPIAPGGQLILPVSFRPALIGEHSIIINYTDNQNGNATTILSGIGVAPQISMPALDFGTLIVHSLPKTEEVVIHNLGYEQAQYSDTLYIYDFRANIAGQISDVTSNFGTEGFKYSKSSLEFPIKIAPGENISIPFEFSPQYSGNAKAALLAVSNTLHSDTLYLTGQGVPNSLKFTGQTVNTCVGSPTYIIAELSNLGIIPVNISELKFSETTSVFTFTDPDIASGFVLDANETKEIEILFSPFSTINQKINLFAYLEGSNDLYTSTEIHGIAENCKLDINISPFFQPYEPGSIIKLNASVSNLAKLDNYMIKDLKVFVEFNSDMILPNPNLFEVSKSLSGIFVLDNYKRITANSFEFIFKSVSGVHLKDVNELFTIAFKTYLPKDTINYSNVNLQITSSSASYVEFTTNTAEIKLGPICASDLRRVHVSDYDYELSSVQPNPARDVININFSIGLKAHTTIEVYNSVGNTILIPYNCILESGEYEISIPTETLPNGKYWLRINSAHYSDTNEFIIMK